MQEAALNYQSSLEQLDDFSIMNILDFLPIEDLIKIAAINPRFADIITHHYIISKFRFHERPIIVYFVENVVVSMHEHSNGRRDFLSRDTNDTLLVLKIFGPIFTHLRYEVHHLDDETAETIFEYAAKYSPQSTKDVDIFRADKKALANWAHEFDETSKQIVIRQHDYDSIRMKHLFPFMEDLIVHNLEKSITHHYPHLTKCTINSYSNDHQNENVHELIRLNPQLRHFHTTMKSDAKYMKLMSEVLVNLESLSIKMTTHSNHVISELVRFKSVKEFTLYVSTNENYPFRTVFGNIQFDQLEALKLTIHSIGAADDRLIEIIGMNKGLKKLETNVRMRNESLVSLLEALPELEEIQLHCNEKGMIDSIEPLFSTNHRLNKIHFRFCEGMSIDDFEEFAAPKWEIVQRTIANDNSFVFTRNNW